MRYSITVKTHLRPMKLAIERGERVKTVLLVEDDTDLRLFLVEALPFYGHFAVVGAADGGEGLERASELQPDCMVIDVKMPTLNGYQLTLALRGDTATASIPLIILTALTQDRDRFTGLAAGADRFIQKPIRPQELAAQIQEVLAISAADRRRDYRALAEGKEQSSET